MQIEFYEQAKKLNERVVDLLAERGNPQADALNEVRLLAKALHDLERRDPAAFQDYLEHPGD